MLFRSIGEEYFTKPSEEGTDYHAIERGYVSVTPMRSDMTDHNSLVALDTWNTIGAAEVEREGEDQPAGR